jgi:hypothetical protein
LEQQKFFSRAIDSYLKVEKSSGADDTTLMKAWQRAATLANDREPQRARDVSEEVAKRLMTIRRHREASRIYVDQGTVKKRANKRERKEKRGRERDRRENVFYPVTSVCPDHLYVHKR